MQSLLLIVLATFILAQGQLVPKVFQEKGAAFFNSITDDEPQACLARAGITKEDIEKQIPLIEKLEVFSDELHPAGRRVKCSLIYCMVNDKNIIKADNSSLDYGYIEQKLRADPLSNKFTKAIDDILQCANPKAKSDFCADTYEFLDCLEFKVNKYKKPLLKIEESLLETCSGENHASRGELKKLGKDDGNTISQDAKCLLACLLDHKGAVKNNKLDVEFLDTKMEFENYSYDIEANPSDTLPKFKNCSPKVTDPSGSKNLCEGAYDLFSCLLKTTENLISNRA